MVPAAFRSDLPFRRPALVLSGGGALGAYEVGVLKVLERVGFRPAVVAGVSVGAINAAIWIAHDFRTAALERTWLKLTASSLGMRWLTLLLRTLGGFVAMLGVLEIVLTLAGSPELGAFRWLWRRPTDSAAVSSVFLDALAWGVVATVGLIATFASRRTETWLARVTPLRDPQRFQRWLGRGLLVGAAVHLVTWGLGLPWPHRFSATILTLAALVWLSNRPGRAGAGLRHLFMHFLPETAGRGLWGGAARRQVLERLIAEGSSARLETGEPHLIVSACAVDNGRVCHFINWHDSSGRFAQHVDASLGEAIEIAGIGELMQAAVASSAMPAIFEPVRIRGRDFIDAGGFSNQPLHAALADDADCALVVLLSPSERPSTPEADFNLFQLAGRLVEIANWRDLQLELRAMPSDWSRERDAARGEPARLCVVEPAQMLEGGVLGFDPLNAVRLMDLGELDALRALELAGWLEPTQAE